jgi:hypothetical protein
MIASAGLELPAARMVRRWLLFFRQRLSWGFLPGASAKLLAVFASSCRLLPLIAGNPPINLIGPSRKFCQYLHFCAVVFHGHAPQWGKWQNVNFGTTSNFALHLRRFPGFSMLSRKALPHPLGTALRIGIYNRGKHIHERRQALERRMMFGRIFCRCEPGEDYGQRV